MFILTAVFPVGLFFFNLAEAFSETAQATEGVYSSGDFLGQVFEWIGEFGGLSFVLKMSGFVSIVIASMKVSFFRPYWDKLGYYKAFAAPVLSLVVGIISLFVGDQTFSWSLLAAYCISGVGAHTMHEILDTTKAIPGLSPIYLKLIDTARALLGGPNPLPADSAIPAFKGTPHVPSAGDTLTDAQKAAGLVTVGSAGSKTNPDGSGQSGSV